MTTAADDEIVVGLTEGNMSASSASRVNRNRSSQAGVDMLGEIAAFGRAMRIIEEDRLRQEIARHEAIQREDPVLWRRLEQQRLVRNRQTAALNRKLRAAGCRPLERELSLKQRLTKLQRLEARNRAETETFQKTK